MSTRKPKSVLDQERYTAELSTGQLVLGVCILLMFGLGCFLLGVLIGKFDPTLDQPVQTASLPPDATRVPVTTIVDVPPPAPKPEPQAASTGQPAEDRPPTRELDGGSAVAPAALDPAPAVPSATVAEAGTVKDEIAAEAERNQVAPPAAQPQVAAAEPPPAPAETAPAAPKAEDKPAEKPEEKAAAATEKWSGFGVQIIAVERPRAEAALKSLQSRTAYKARVMPGKGTLFRVVVGPYTERSAAEKARDDLKAKGYKDAFLLVLK